MARHEPWRLLAGVTPVALPCAVLAILLAAGCSSAPPPADVAQAGPLQAMSPVGAIDWPFEFRWRGGSADAVVRVHIFDEAERAIYSIDARGTRAPAPDDLGRLLKSGSPYLWRVARLDENGREVDQSELTAFSVR